MAQGRPRNPLGVRSDSSIRNDRSGASSAFVACAPGEFRHSIPERVAFGTVPVPNGNAQKQPSLRAEHCFSRFHWQPWVLTPIGDETVGTETVDFERSPRPIKGREPRTQSIATRFTRAEERTLLKKAEGCGQNLREWARDVLLRSDSDGRESEMELHIFTELVGIQMLLMNTLEPLLCGEKLTREQVAAQFRQVQATKAAKAHELLARRSQIREK